MGCVLFSCLAPEPLTHLRACTCSSPWCAVINNMLTQSSVFDNGVYRHGAHHWIHYGVHRNYRGSRGFRASEYQERNPDVVKWTGRNNWRNLVLHYAAIGAPLEQRIGNSECRWRHTASAAAAASPPLPGRTPHISVLQLSPHDPHVPSHLLLSLLLPTLAPDQSVHPTTRGTSRGRGYQHRNARPGKCTCAVTTSTVPTAQGAVLRSGIATNT